jgi:hypothetical protein
MEKENVPTHAHGTLDDLLKALDYLIENKLVNGETLFVTR